MHRALTPWSEALIAQMVPSVHRISSDKHIALMSFEAVINRWPDTTHAARFTTGFDMIGDIEVSHVLRPLSVDSSGLTGFDILLDADC